MQRRDKVTSCSKLLHLATVLCQVPSLLLHNKMFTTVFSIVFLPVCIHSDVVAAQQRPAQMAIVSPTVTLVHRNNHQASFCGLDVLDRIVLNFVAAEREKGERCH